LWTPLLQSLWRRRVVQKSVVVTKVKISRGIHFWIQNVIKDWDE
jgi:hypothetical protein